MMIPSVARLYITGRSYRFHSKQIDRYLTGGKKKRKEQKGGGSATNNWGPYQTYGVLEIERVYRYEKDIQR